MDYPATSTDTGLDREVRNYLRGTDDMLPDIVYLMARCDEDVTIRKTLAEVAQEFCRETGCFEYETPVDLANDTTRYKLDIPWPADVLMVKKAKLFTVTSAGVETEQYTLDVQQFTVEDPTDEDGVYLNLGSAINAQAGGDTYRLKVTVQLVPYFDEMVGTQATALPDKWLRRWRSAIVSGAVALLAAMERKPWTDKELAGAHAAKYKRLRGEAWMKANGPELRNGGVSASYGIPWC